MKNPPYQSGEHDQKIKIIRDDVDPDGIEGEETTPVEVMSLWASIKAGKPVEKLSGDAIRVFEEVTFNIRRPKEPILESDRILYNGKYYEIRGIPTVNPRNLFIDIFAERGVDV